MSAIALTIQALLNDSDVFYAVGDRIWPTKSTQGTVEPHLVVNLISEAEPVLLQGSTCIATSLVRIDCRASTATQAMCLGENVKVALRDVVDASYLGRIVSFRKSFVDFSHYDDNGLHTRSIDFEAKWQ